ncbi:MAG: hypothetical protein ACI3Y4_07980 [Candidatus Cryptobacteroides sp.]
MHDARQPGRRCTDTQPWNFNPNQYNQPLRQQLFKQPLKQFFKPLKQFFKPLKQFFKPLKQFDKPLQQLVQQKQRLQLPQFCRKLQHQSEPQLKCEHQPRNYIKQHFFFPDSGQEDHYCYTQADHNYHHQAC